MAAFSKYYPFFKKADKNMLKVFPRPPDAVYRQSRNLQRHLVRSRFRELPHSDASDLDDRPAGCYRHLHGNRGGGKRCKLCLTLNVSSHFSTSYTGLEYRMRHHLTCKSKYTVYLITCKLCQKQSNGSSTDPCTRGWGSPPGD